MDRLDRLGWVWLLGLLAVAASLCVAVGEDGGEIAGGDHPLLLQDGDGHAKQQEGHGDGGGHHGVALASWRWDEYGGMFLCTVMLILAVLVKTFFHHIPYVSKFLPESCFLILLGVALAGISYVGFRVDKCNSHFPKFTPNLFFNVLLPPIILDSSFSLCDRDFLSNIRSVLTFAVAGTIFNIFAIGFSLYGLACAGAFGEFWVEPEMDCYQKEQMILNPDLHVLNDTAVLHQLGAVESLIFSSLISAVDPVAVLAIFEEIKVNTGLYFLVFGESILNDGVTVVLYNTMIGIADITIGAKEVILAVLSFFAVVFGGFFIGIINGGLVGFLTTKTKSSREIEPLLVFAFGYSAFILAELFHWSGIISIIGFGLVVKRYAMTNMSQKSYTTVKYATKTLAATSDCIIFLFLGMVTISEDHHVNWRFVFVTIALCTVYRFIGTFFLSWLSNRKRNNRIKFTEQFIVAYGGLRGAVGFSLAVVLNEQKWYRELFLTTALAMVFFTGFIQGSTIKFFVKLMGISLKEKEEGVKNMGPQIQESLIDNIMGGMEVLIGRSGHYGAFQMFNHFDNKYIRHYLISKEKKENLERAFDKIILEEHYTSLYGPRILAKTAVTVKGTEEPNLKPLEYTKSKNLKAWTNAIANSSWGKYQNKMDDDVAADDQSLLAQLEKRKERAKTMESKILLSKQQTYQEPPAEDEDVTMRHLQVRSDKRKSMIASLIISEYDRVSGDKRQRMSLSAAPERKSGQRNVGFQVISELDEGETEL
eukprot:GFUD01016198.1.p1 GENE.GFUD01016198.1~~GFUD01016198.1.p1  ORF type:complete len:762 (+),score=173.52 GFUD01016198.1:44-2329(+)